MIMKRSTFLALTFVALGVPSSVRPQAAPAKWADTISMEIEQAQITGDGARLDAAAALAGRVAAAFPSDGLIQHYHGYAIYRQGILKVGQGKDGSAEFEQAKSILERSLKTRPLAETHMLLSAIDGQLIAKSPMKAMFLGMASAASTKDAMALGPNNPRVWLLRGQGAIFTPSEYGGGLDVAAEHLKRAIELFETDAPKPGEPSWGKAEAYLWLGQVYQKKGDKAKAAELYKTALEISPKYGYAKMLASALK